jgi:hypothetical protein
VRLPHATPLAAALAGALIVLWLIVEPRTPDLAAQVYRVGLFHRIGFAVWDEHWYGGHHLTGYSLLFPPLGALLGARLTGALAALASAVLFDRLLGASESAATRLAAPWFAVAAVGDLWIGRLTFALGVPLALGAVLALRRGHTPAACVLGALTAAASPVAGALLGLAGLTATIAGRRPREMLVLAGPAAAVVLALALLFPEGGFEPFPLLSFLASSLVTLAFVWALGPKQPLLRTGAWVYLLASSLCLLVHSPVGSNVERYAVLLAGPALLLSGPRRGAATAVALGAIALFVAWGPVRETLAVAGNASTSASYYAPVKRFLAGLPEPARVEVPLTRSHWEAALLAPDVSLARGWEKQLEERYDRVLLSGRLTAATYERWLREQAVAYVALPDTQLDPSSAREGRLIAAGVPFLERVFSSRHWRVYRVLGSPPLLAGPGRLTALGNDSFAVRAYAPGRLLVRVRFTRYWTVTVARGCVRPAPDGWTYVTVPAAGPVVVAARFSLAGAFASGGSCSGGAGA